jgi:hypothetical protein
VLEWLASEMSEIDQSVKFDRTGDPKDEPYYITGNAAGLNREQGKTCTLAFGYIGGVGAYRKLAKELQSPIPLLAIRHMVPSDFLFLAGDRGDTAMLIAYFRYFATGIPSRVRKQIVKLLSHRQAMEKQIPNPSDWHL